MAPDKAIEQSIAALAEYRERSATDLARGALSIMQTAAGSFPEEGLGAYLDGVGVLILLSLPSVASVKNTVSRARRRPAVAPWTGQARLRPRELLA
jgi:hypothetical protein